MAIDIFDAVIEGTLELAAAVKDDVLLLAAGWVLLSRHLRRNRPAHTETGVAGLAGAATMSAVGHVVAPLGRRWKRPALDGDGPCQVDGSGEHSGRADVWDIDVSGKRHDEIRCQFHQGFGFDAA